MGWLVSCWCVGWLCGDLVGLDWVGLLVGYIVGWLVYLSVCLCIWFFVGWLIHKWVIKYTKVKFFIYIIYIIECMYFCLYGTLICILFLYIVIYNLSWLVLFFIVLHYISFFYMVLYFIVLYYVILIFLVLYEWLDEWMATYPKS